MKQENWTYLELTVEDKTLSSKNFSTGDFSFNRDENAELLRKMTLPKKKKNIWTTRTFEIVLLYDELFEDPIDFSIDWRNNNLW